MLPISYNATLIRSVRVNCILLNISISFKIYIALLEEHSDQQSLAEMYF